MAKLWTDYAITQGFNPPTEWGIDIGTPFGTPITAILPGQVIAEGYHPWGGETDILARLPNGQQVIEYVLHLDTIDPSIVPGVWVKSGQKIGTSGGQLAGGNAPVDPKYSTGPHVEFGLFQGSMWSGKAVDPSPYVSQFGAPGQTDPGQLAGAATNPLQSLFSATSAAIDPGGGTNPIASLANSQNALLGFSYQNIVPLVVAAIILLVIFGTGEKKPNTTNVSVINTGAQGGGRVGASGTGASVPVVPA
jgi:hypothetical protein